MTMKKFFVILLFALSVVALVHAATVAPESEGGDSGTGAPGEDGGDAACKQTALLTYLLIYLFIMKMYTGADSELDMDVGGMAQSLGRRSLAGGYSPIYALIFGSHVTTSWVRCPLWVNQPGQLSLPSFRGR